MKPNLGGKVSIERLKEFERMVIPALLNQPEKWNSLDVDYYPPRVERLFLEHKNGYRIHLHVIHKTEERCLYHKHRWPAVFKQVFGSYKMGVTYSQEEIGSDEAHSMPDVVCFEVSAGSYYEMTQTDAMHYVRPITPISGSIMLTNELYPEHVFRKEVLNKPLNKLSELRKLEILNLFKKSMNK